MCITISTLGILGTVASVGFYQNSATVRLSDGDLL